jgi:hypothetical protein
MNKTELKNMSEDEVLAHIAALEEAAAAHAEAVKALEAKVTEAETARDTAEAAVLELNKALANSEQVTFGDKPTVTIGKEKYTVIAGIRLNEEWTKKLGKPTATAADIAKNQKLAEYLVGAGSGVLQVIIDTEK